MSLHEIPHVTFLAFLSCYRHITEYGFLLAPGLTKQARFRINRSSRPPRFVPAMCFSLPIFPKTPHGGVRFFYARNANRSSCEKIKKIVNILYDITVGTISRSNITNCRLYIGFYRYPLCQHIREIVNINTTWESQFIFSCVIIYEVP